MGRDPVPGQATCPTLHDAVLMPVNLQTQAWQWPAAQTPGREGRRMSQ